MLYSIIPPVLIILSLSGIIIFFMKKAPQIANLPDAEALEIEGVGETEKKSGFFKKINWDGIKHGFLVVLEKMTRRARILFLKLESKSKELNDSIRHKRKSRLENNGSKVGDLEEDDIIKRVKEYQPDRKRSYLTSLKKGASQDKSAEEKEVHEEEKKIRPTVSDRVVVPKTRTEMKDRLEDLLIERIAVNPKDIEAYERLGEYYMEIGNVNDAKECYKQVLKLDPKNRNVKYRMRKIETMMHK